MAVNDEPAWRNKPMSRANANPTADGITWHTMTVDQVVRRLTTDIEKGLGAGEASSQLQKYGPNRLPEGKKRGPFIRFLSQFNNILVYVLLGAGFTKLMLNLWVDAAIIFGVVVLNALLGFVQEGKAEKALESIRNMLSAEARTLRGGETRMIAAEQLVPGDIVLLESGDKIPADLRLIDAKNLRTEEAALTGRQEHRSGFHQRDCRGSEVHGVLRNHGGVRPCDGRRCRDRQPDGAWPHQCAACRRERARDAAPAPDQEVRLRHYRRHRCR